MLAFKKINLVNSFKTSKRKKRHCRLRKSAMPFQICSNNFTCKPFEAHNRYVFSLLSFAIKLGILERKAQCLCEFLVLTFYSSSIVAGGLPVQSYITRLMWGTSFTMRLVTLKISSQGRAAGSAVIKSVVVTARSAIA